MARRKLTLSVDEEVIEKARRYSAEHKTSISRLVTTFLAALPSKGRRLEPAVDRLMGLLPGDVDRAEHGRWLDEKHLG